jgi:hypothetical protein
VQICKGVFKKLLFTFKTSVRVFLTSLLKLRDEDGRCFPWKDRWTKKEMSSCARGIISAWKIMCAFTDLRMAAH